MNGKENYIKVGFLFYIGFTIAKTIDEKYRTKVTSAVKNFLKTKED